MSRPEDIAVAKSRWREAQAALRTSLDQFKKRTLVAPFGGIIVSKRVAVEQMVAPGAPLFVLASLKEVEIFVETDEEIPQGHLQQRPRYLHSGVAPKREVHPGQPGFWAHNRHAPCSQRMATAQHQSTPNHDDSFA